MPSLASASLGIFVVDGTHHRHYRDVASISRVAIGRFLACSHNRSVANLEFGRYHKPRLNQREVVERASDVGLCTN